MMMMTTKVNKIPDRARPGSTTPALSIKVNQGGSGKLATGDKNHSQKEGKINLLKHTMTTGTWNVRTLYAAGKLKELCHEMSRYKWNVLGLAEVRWPNIGETVTEDGHKIWHSGESVKHEKGVAVIVHKDSTGSVIECRPISSRMMSIRMAAKPQNITIIQVYAPTSAAPDEEINRFYEELESLTAVTPKKDILIVQGDWNAKIGTDAYADWAGTVGKFGCGETNERGYRLLEYARLNNLIATNTLYPHKPSRRTTWHSPDGVNHNQIDYIWMTKRFQTGVVTNKTRTFPGADVGSDHDLVLMTMKIKLCKTPRQKSNSVRIKFNLDKLNDPEIREEFKAKIGGSFAPLLLLTDVQEMTDSFTEQMQEIALETLGKQRTVKHPWVSNEALALCDERRELKGKRHNGPQEAQEYRQKNCAVRKEMRKSKEEWVISQCKALEMNLNRNETRKAFDIVRKLTRAQIPRVTTIEDKEGKLLTGKKEVMSRWGEYCKELYSEKKDVRGGRVVNLPSDGRQEEKLPIILEEVKEAIRSLKGNKASGVDNITAELLQKGGEAVEMVLLKICNLVWEGGTWPKQWKRSIIIPIPKKGNLKQCGNYRTISLISHASKVLLRILLKRLKPLIEPILSEEQAGFRAGRSTTEQIFNLRILIEKYCNHQRELWHGFIDFQKAFDTVWHQGLWAIMEHHNIDQHLTRCIRSLYEDAESAVLIGDTFSPWFHTEVGVRQGCPLSPDLFNLFLEQIMAEVLEPVESTVSVCGRVINNLRFADDIDLIAGCPQELEELTTRLAAKSAAYGMKINADKSKIMVTGLQKDAGEHENRGAIYVDGMRLEQVGSFKYLGAVISGDGRSLDEVKTRIAIATSAMARLKKLWYDKNITLVTKIKLMRAVVTSTALYGCESWTLTAEIERRIQAFDQRCLRRLLKIPYTAHRTNHSVYTEVQNMVGRYESLLSTVKKRKMTWFGHINRGNGLATTMLQGMVDGKRGRGRPRISWMDNIRKWSTLEPGKLHQMTRDRQRWKDFVADVAHHHDPTIAAVTG